MIVTIKSAALAKALGVKVDSKFEVKTDERGVPLDRYWRNRFKDSVIDNCILIPKKKELK